MFVDWLKAMVNGSMGGLGLLIFMGIVMIGAIAVAVSKRKKVFYGFLALALGFYVYAKCTCGPSFFDVRIMHPVAEKISEYIVKNGIPKSLKDIPDLPYGLEGCERSEEYWIGSNGGWVSANINNAEIYNIEEICSYENIKIELGATFELKSHTMSGLLHMLSLNETVLNLFFKSNKKEKIIFEKVSIGSQKDNSICNPMK